MMNLEENFKVNECQSDEIGSAQNVWDDRVQSLIVHVCLSGLEQDEDEDFERLVWDQAAQRRFMCKYCFLEAKRDLVDENEETQAGFQDLARFKNHMESKHDKTLDAALVQDLVRALVSAELSREPGDPQNSPQAVLAAQDANRSDEQSPRRRKSILSDQFNADAAQLQTKVIKHWFRNALFKERHRDNFSSSSSPDATSCDSSDYARPMISAACHAPTPPPSERPSTSCNDSDEPDDNGHSVSIRDESLNCSGRPSRTKFTNEQTKALTGLFMREPYPKDNVIATIAAELELTHRVVTVWFQNARQKARRRGCADLGRSCAASTASNERVVDDSEAPKDQGDAASSAERPRANAAKALQYVISVIKAHQQKPAGFAEPNESTEKAPEDVGGGSNESSNEDASLTTDNKKTPTPHRTKRLRTTILLQQQEYLMKAFKENKNPNRLMLDEIAQHVQLDKKVVQVWFQNTRARERKGVVKKPLPVESDSGETPIITPPTTGSNSPVSDSRPAHEPSEADKAEEPAFESTSNQQQDSLSSSILPAAISSEQQQLPLVMLMSAMLQRQQYQHIIMSSFYAQLEQQRQKSEHATPLDLSLNGSNSTESPDRTASCSAAKQVRTTSTNSEES